ATNTYVNYRQSFRKLLAIPLPFTKGKLFPLPEQVTWGYTENKRETRSYDRVREKPDSLVQRPVAAGRAATIGFGADLRPIELISYHIDGQRNLSLEDRLSEHLFG